MLREEYVPAAVDDWYYRRKRDAEGRFFWTISGSWGKVGDGETRQQLTCLTPGGTVLSRKNEGHRVKQVRERLRQGLKDWKSLPEEERRPGAIKVEALTEPDARYVPPSPPPGGLVLKVYTRCLDRDERGKLRRATLPGDDCERAKEKPQHDRMWLTEEEWRSLAPADLKKGEEVPLPKQVVRRLFRFHLADNSHCVVGALYWQPREIRSGGLILKVEEATGTKVKLRLEGSALLATDADPSKAEKSYEARLLGFLDYDLTKKVFTRFDLAALGEYWSSGARHPGRVGRHPLGIAFELVRGDSAADRVPPDATREGMDRYLKADK